jgi:hypothetical protein
MNLFLGRAIVIVLKFNDQPRMTLVLVSPVLALSFAQASMSSRGRGSKGETSREMAVSPRRGARSRRVVLSESSRSTVSPMKLLMYTSTMPLALTGMLAMRSHPGKLSAGLHHR